MRPIPACGGLERGYCLIIGGEAEAVTRLAPILDAFAPGEEAASPTAGRTRSGSTAPRGWLHCSPAGAGHFVKMVHNGSEYGLMAAYAEGLNLLRHADAGRADRAKDAETTPLAHPERLQYRFNLAESTAVCRHELVIGSWLPDLTPHSLAADATRERFSGSVSDSGERRWTVRAGTDAGAPLPALTAALYDRFSSRAEAEFAHEVLSALRFAFGGHVEQQAGS